MGSARLVFTLPRFFRMDTQNPSATSDFEAQPAYGEFGNPVAPTAAAPGRSGANDNPDEFSEFDDREKDAKKAPDNPEDQPGHVEQNQDPAAVRAARDKDDETQREAWAKDDPRYAGGGTHNTREEPAGNPATDE